MLEEIEVLELIRKDTNHFKRMKDSLKVNGQELDSVLKEMISKDIITFDKDINAYFELKKGIIEIKQAGFGFIVVEDEDDYFVPAIYIENVYSGDEVLFYAFEKGKKLYNAKIAKVLTRKNKTLVGTVVISKKKKSSKAYVVSTSIAFPVKAVIKGPMLGALDGNLVLCDIIYLKNSINCVIKEVIGDKDDPGIEITEIAYNHGFRKEFPEEVLDEIKSIPDEITESDKIGRKDFTMNNVITIDGDDSKDFDDAVYLKKLDNGNYKLDVYIADVAQYVKDDTPLNDEALFRGTSVYLADRVIPMLPKKLSNGICSLNEGVERLVLACLMEIDSKGNLVNYEICEGVIKSNHRMTYNNVNKILENDKDLCEKYADIKEMLFDMLELSQIIRERRYKKGGIEFEVDEYKITLNPDSSPKDVILRTRGEGEKLIEDFMLQANETVAYHMNIMGLPCAYRVHEKPEQEKLRDVFELISNMGVETKKTKNDIHPKQIQDVLVKIGQTEFAPILNSLLLRSMMKAKYSPKCLGHYGLAMQYYCHFTSPIRRYPDLITHRMIKNLLLNPSDKYNDDLMFYSNQLEEICDQNSKSERNAIDCEREVNDMLCAWYMERYIKKELSGIITSIKNFGMFITLDNGIEGLVSIRDMDGYFDFDEDNLLLSSRTRQYKLGDKVDIVVTAANRKSGKIDFMLKEDYDIYFGMDW